MFAQTRMAYLSNAFCTLLLWVTFWDNANHGWLLVWTGMGVFIMLLREIQSRRYANRSGESIDLAAWTLWLKASLFLNGTFWGIGCASLALIATPYQWPVVLMIAGGLQTGSVLASSYIFSVFTLFSLPLFLCTFLAFLVLGLGGQTGLLVTAMLLVIWSVFIFMCAARFARHYRHSVGFALENEDLAGSLQEKYQENEALNQVLQDRIEELNATQGQLLAEKTRSDGLVEQLQKLSTTDGLTDLGNRRFFDENLSIEWRRAKRDRLPLALVIADVDFFKAYNDRYGHQMGDQCLIQVAAVLAATARRDGDWAARYGGEEFALILANTSLQDATMLAESLREGVFACAMEHESSSIGPYVSLSAGVAAMIPDDARSPEALLAAADEALYAAKQGGRNRVVASPSLPRHSADGGAERSGGQDE